MRAFLIFFTILFLSSCTAVPPESGTKAPLVLKPAAYEALPGWKSEDFKDLKQAMERSCSRILKRSPAESFGPDMRWGTYGDWHPACRELLALQDPSAADLRTFFENHFQPWTVKAGNNTQGLFTGYYESALNGSKRRHGPYQYPLRARPSDLVMVDLGEFREDLKGQRIAGRVRDGKLKPYESHADIITGKLPAAQDRPLVWVDDPADAFFVQIQGSGIINLAEGGQMRIGYAGQNGHPYYAIGRELVKRGYLNKQNVSMQAIRRWLHDNPDQAQEIMTTNPSYVFFHELPSEEQGKGEGPQGGEGLPLTPLRSLAVDRSLIPYGVPVWLDAEHPDQSVPSLHRLMIAQDTGGAIRGPVRGDVFWGHGAQAETLAGKMKSKGRYWFLLPNNL